VKPAGTQLLRVKGDFAGILGRKTGDLHKNCAT